MQNQTKTEREEDVLEWKRATVDLITSDVDKTMQMWPGWGYIRVQEHRWPYTRKSATIWCCVCVRRFEITCLFSFTLPILTHFALSRLLCMQSPLLLMIFTVHTDIRSSKGKWTSVGNTDIPKMKAKAHEKEDGSLKKQIYCFRRGRKREGEDRARLM